MAGIDPAGIAEAHGDGTLVVAYESGGTVVELPPAKMKLYVEQEGLAAQLDGAWRGSAVKDRFSRSAKSLLVVSDGGGDRSGGDRSGGDRSGGGYGRVVGLPLELVPLADPSALAGGGTLPLRLLDHGEPLAGILVTAIPRLDPSHPVRATTGGDGRATLALPRGGEWLVKAVKIRPAPAASGADFESVWASLTFEAPAS